MRDMIRNAQNSVSVGTNVRFQSEKGYWFDFESKDEGIVVNYYMAKTADKSDQIPLVPESNGRISDVYSAFDKIEIKNSEKVREVWIENLRVGETYMLPDNNKKYCICVLEKDSGGE